MARRRLRLLCLALLLFSGAFAFWLYLHRDRATLEDIEVGMAVEDVRAVMARSPDYERIWYSHGLVRKNWIQQWDFSAGPIVVVFDDTGHVIDRHRLEPHPWHVLFLQTVK